MNENLLSLAQQKFWFTDQLEKGYELCNIPVQLKLRGVMDCTALQKALDDLCKRHEILRTTYSSQAAQLEQRVQKSVPLLIKQINLQGLRQQDRALKRLMVEERAVKFNLSQEWPIRACLFRLESDEYVLLITLHQIACDKKSQTLLIDEFANSYSQFCGENTSEKPEPGCQYRTYSTWQAETLRSKPLNEHCLYWQKTLHDIPSIHCFKLDKPRPAQQGFTGGLFKQHLGDDLCKKLSSLFVTEKGNMRDVLQSAFAVLLSRWSNETDIVIGGPLENREHPDYEHAIGHFENFTVFRHDLSPNLNFRELLSQTTQQNTASSRYSDIPFEVLVNQLNPERSLSYTPIFQILFSFVNEVQYQWTTEKLKIDRLCPEELIVNYDLELNVMDQKSGAELHWVYAESLFNKEAIERLSASFKVLLNAIIDSPNKEINQLLLLTDVDKTLLDKWRDNTKKTVSHQFAHEVFEQQVISTPHAIALSFNDVQLSYDELNKRANKLAHYLRSSSVREKTMVALCCDPSLELIIAIFAIMKAGGVYVPIDPNYPKQRIEYILEEAQLEFFISKSDFLQIFPSQKTYQLICMDSSETVSVLSNQSSENLAIQFSTKSNETPAYVIYTSGATGKPKGVVGLHKSIVNRVEWMQDTYPFDKDDVLCLKTSINCVDHLAEVFQPLLYGRHVVVVPQSVRLDVSSFIALLQKENVTRITLVPSLLKSLIQDSNVERLTKLRLLISSGETLSFSLVQECREHLQDVRLLNLYGSTETGADITCYEVNDVNYFDIMKYFRPNHRVNYFNKMDLGFNKEGNLETSLHILKDMFKETEIPNKPFSIDRYLHVLKDSVIPGIVQVSSQTYIGHMTSALPTFMPEFSKLISHLNQNVVKVETSLSITFLERQVLAMMHKLFYAFPQKYYNQLGQDPHHMFGVVTSGGSVSNLTALWCARNKALVEQGVSKEYLVENGAIQAQIKLGYSGGVIIGSRLMHYSMRKIASLFGIGEKSIRYVPQQDNQKISMENLEVCIKEAHANGEYVIALVGVAGATETGTIDPLNNIADIAEKYKIHFHVDAAWGGAFKFSEKYNSKLSGIERADSITLCPHKQLYVPQGMSLCLFKNSQSAKNIAVYASYQAMEGSYDLGQYSLEGSRPANSVLLHASLHLISTRGYEYLVDQSMENARYFKQLIHSTDCFELIGDPEINIINYRYVPRTLYNQEKTKYTKNEQVIIDDAVKLIQEFQFSHGKTFVSKTRILDKRQSSESIWVFRVVLSNPMTTRENLHEVLQEQLSIAAKHINESEEGSVCVRDFGDEEKDRFEHRIIPIGKPIYNTNISILDQNLEQVPIGAVGELCVGGDGLAKGYIGASQKSLGKFVERSSAKGENSRIFRTGDLARWLPEGNLQYLGRVDRQIKLRGFRIELGEIEYVLTTQGGVEEAVVTLEVRKGGSKYLVAYVESSVVGIERKLRQKLSENLPAHMIPSKFIRLNNIPLTPNGKLDRTALSSLKEGHIQLGHHKPPRNKDEQKLVKFWSKMLNLSEDSVGIDDNFFELGGNSLLVIQVVTEAKKINLNFTINELFHSQTIRQLAEIIAYDGESYRLTLKQNTELEIRDLNGVAD